MKIKKILSTILVCFLSLFLVACGKQPDTKIANINPDDEIIMRDDVTERERLEAIKRKNNMI